MSLSLVYSKSNNNLQKSLLKLGVSIIFST